MGWRGIAQQQARRGEICPVCLGLGVVRPGEYPYGHPQFGTLVRCVACSGGQVPNYLRRASGLSGWMARADFGNYYETNERTNQLEVAKSLVARGYGWLTYWGSHGRGKSYLLAAIVNESLAGRRPAVYVTAGRLLDHLRDAYGPSGIGYSQAFDHWCQCQVLAIDEADEYHDTSWAQDKYRQLLDYRYNLVGDGDSITVFATNPEPGGPGWPEELSWLASRMRQFQVVQARGGDIRPEISKSQEHWSDKL